MEFKGTKGKWIIDPNHTISIIDSSGDSMNELICQISGKLNKEENKANTLLISKAPELLQILHDCIQILKVADVEENMIQTYGNLLVDAENLIKEATTL